MYSDTSLLRICLFHVFFGKIPEWFPYFLKSCEYNKEIQFIIVTDNCNCYNDSENIKRIFLTKNEFSLLMQKNTKITANLSNPYKICDFRPAFGEIFKDYLHAVDYWGYCDNDVIFGKLSGFIPKSVIARFDILSVYKDYLSGPFCLYKNSEKICSLYRQATGYMETLSSEKHYAFDENIPRLVYKGINLDKIRLIIKYLGSPIKKRPFLYKNLKFNFQWYYKKSKLKETLQPIDMTEVIWRNQDELKVCFRQLLHSDREYERLNKKTWRLIWKEGHLTNLNSGEGLFAFHFVNSKFKNTFKIKKWNDRKDFLITSKGIS